MAGARSPTVSTTYPSVAARLYAGAVEPNPMVTLPHRPRAPVCRPLPACCSSWRPPQTLPTPPSPPAGRGERFHLTPQSCTNRLTERPNLPQIVVRKERMLLHAHILVGSGGVGDAFARIAARRPFFEAAGGRRLRPGAGGAYGRRGRATTRFVAAQVDASDADSVAALVRAHRGTHVMNAVDPRFVMPIFDGAYAAGADYLDMAMSLSQPDVEQPYDQGRGQARRRAVRQGGAVGAGGPAGAGRDGRGAGAVRRVRPLRRRRAVLRDR